MPRKYLPESLRHYKIRDTYTNPKNQVIDIIIKRGYDRYEAECIFNALWKLHDRNPQKIAAAIVNLKGGSK